MNSQASRTQPLIAKCGFGRFQIRGVLPALTAFLEFYQLGKTGETRAMLFRPQAILIGAGPIFALWLALRSLGHHLNGIQYIKTLVSRTPHNKK